MSKETKSWLNRFVLRGHTDMRGHAWHYSAAMQGDESNHYPGAIPIEDLYRRLFGWNAVPRPVFVPASDSSHVEMIDVDMPEMIDGEATGGTVTVQLPDPHCPLGFRRVNGSVAWVRDDTEDVLGIHGDGYKGHQYAEWLVKNVLTMVGGDMDVANAGLLKNGAVAWVQIERPDNVDGSHGVVVRPFILATTSFDGSIATTIKDGWTDTVCDNTYQAFMSEPGLIYRSKHTRNSVFDPTAARIALDIVTESALKDIDTLLSIDVSDAQWSAFVKAHAPIADDAKGRAVTMAENVRGELTRLWNSDVRVSPWRGTAWGVVQAVNTFNSHLSIIRNVSGGRFERNITNAVKGITGKADRATVATLETVIDRKILVDA